MPTALQSAVGLAVKIGLAVVVVGMLRRGLHRRCWSLLVCLLAVLIYGCIELTGVMFYDVPGLEWPQWLWSWEFWNFQQTAYDVATLAVAVEIGVRVVAAFPGTWRLTRALLGTALLTTTVAVTLGQAPLHPLLATAAIWLFAAVSLVIILFNLPVHAWHRAILTGFVPYLFVFSTLTSIFTRRGYELAKILGSVDQVANLLLIAWLAYAAWRDDDVADVSPAVLQRLGLAQG